jgi:hypothetical protein
MDRPLGVIKRTGFIRAAGSNHSRQLRGVFSAGKFVQNPGPIVFGIGVLAGVLLRWDCMGQRQGIYLWNIQRKVTWIRNRIARILCRMDNSTFEPPESTLKLLAIPFGGDPACMDCNRVLRVPGFRNCNNDPSYPITVRYPIFAERCREDCGRRGNYIGRPEQSKAGLSVDIEIYIQIPHRGDGIFGAFASLRAKWIGSKVDLGSGNYDEEPA